MIITFDSCPNIAYDCPLGPSLSLKLLTHVKMTSLLYIQGPVAVATVPTLVTTVSICSKINIYL